MTILNDLLALCCGEPESTTLSVKLYVPDWVGVPEMVPVVAANVSPAGNLPDGIDHVNAGVPPVVATVSAYATPTVPLLNEDVVIVRVAGAIVTVYDWDAFSAGCEESETWMVNVDLPLPVGLPEIVPLLLRLKPAGSVPEETVHAYGVMPPVAARVDEYDCPFVPLGNEVVVMTRGCTDAAMATVNDFESDNCGEDESTTFRVKVKDPTAVGVPERMPPLLKVSPVGNDPERTLHEYGVLPPEAERIDEYDCPFVPSGNEVVVMTTGCTEPAMVTVNDFESVNCGEDESATFTVKVEDPTVVGVPERMPPLLKVKPPGSDPERTLQEYGVTPPAALNVAA